MVGGKLIVLVIGCYTAEVAVAVLTYWEFSMFL